MRDYTRVNGKSATPVTLEKITCLLRAFDFLGMKIQTVNCASHINSSQVFETNTFSMKHSFEDVDDIYSTIAWQMVLQQPDQDDIRLSIETTREEVSLHVRERE